MSTLIAGTLATPGGAADGWVEVEGDRIAEVGDGAPPRRPDVAHRGLVAAGLCDLQVNGAAGVEVTDGPAALDRIDALELAHGVTSYLPTVITTDPDTASRTVAEVAERVADPSSPVAGVHLEGPFLAPDFRGVHRERLLVLPDGPRPSYYDADCVRLITVAPELPGAHELIEGLAQRGVTVSIGHSGAIEEDASTAFGRGVRFVTHLFNAMRPLHHREPGLVGWALVEDGVTVGVVADGLHVGRTTLKLIARAARDRVVLVSDSSPAAGAKPGRYRLAGVEIEGTPDGRSQTLDGQLAGSAVTLDEIARRWARSTSTSLSDALVAAGERPARSIGLDSGLRAGAAADLVLVTGDGDVERVMRHGAWVGG